MSELLFIRHAATDLAGTFCGQSDPALNEEGWGQVAGLLRSLSSGPIQRVVSSDLCRARETAKGIADAYQVEVTLDPALREIDFGDWEGLRWAEIEVRDPELARRWVDTFPETPAPGGETFAVFRARVLDAVDRLSESAWPGCTAVVTHAGVMRLLLEERQAFSATQAWAQTKAYCSCFSYKSGERT